MAWKASYNVITQGTANRLYSDYHSSSFMHVYLFSVHTPMLPLFQQELGTNAGWAAPVWRAQRVNPGDRKTFIQR